MASKTVGVCKYITIFALAYFFLFVVFSIIIGGDALNGFIEQGHYYVTSHGKNTEVSKFIWYLSRIQAIAVFVIMPIGMISGGIYKSSKIMKYL
jgi:hypothetical protein